MNRTIKKFLNENLPQSEIESIFGNYNLRFELGANLKNGTVERTNQVTERATRIYDESIGFDEIIMVIQQYDSEFYDSDNKYFNYFFDVISRNKFEQFKGPFDQTYYEIDKKGIKVEKILNEELDCDLYIGKLNMDRKNIELIIRGIANLEMGLEPKIPQSIYFYSIKNKIGFRIYDDRGCDVWANDKEKLRPIYESLNSWILDYNRPEIDKYFV